MDAVLNEGNQQNNDGATNGQEAGGDGQVPGGDRAGAHSLGGQPSPDVCHPDPTPVVSAVRALLAPSDDTPNRGRSRSITHTRVITSDEFYKEIREKEDQKKKKEEEKLARAAAREENKKRKADKQKDSNKNSKKKKEVQAADNTDEDSDVDDPSECGGSEEEMEAESNEDVDNELCGKCGKSFQHDFNGEQWIQCSVKDCNAWFHMKCVSITKYVKTFRCDGCTPLKPKPKRRCRK